MEKSNAQHANPLTTAILPTTAGIYYDLNDFGPVVYVVQTNIYALK